MKCGRVKIFPACFRCQSVKVALQFAPFIKQQEVRYDDIDCNRCIDSVLVVGVFPGRDLELVAGAGRDRAGGCMAEPDGRRYPENCFDRAGRVCFAVRGSRPAPPFHQQLYPQTFSQDSASSLTDRTGSAGRRHGVVGRRVVQRPPALEPPAGDAEDRLERARTGIPRQRSRAALCPAGRLGYHPQTRRSVAGSLAIHQG